MIAAMATGRRPRLVGPAACALALAAALSLSACGGDDDETTTVTAPGVSETTPAETSSAEASGPSGVLTTDGVGSVEQGMSTAEVRGYFGDPVEERKEPGCELAGPNAPKVLLWRYDVKGGQLTLRFDEAGESLESYRTDSPGFETERGDRVGDFFAAVQDSWGERLEAVPLGEPTETLGFWWVRDGPTRALLFDIRRGRVAEIQGGEIQFCE